MPRKPKCYIRNEKGKQYLHGNANIFTDLTQS